MKSPIHKRRGAKLPHWTAEGATYSVTFRLKDAIPEDAATKLTAELEGLRKRMEKGGEMSIEDQVRYTRLQSERIEELLHAGSGECLMRNPVIAQVVADALQFFDTERYRLLAWCVMPNHVHAVFTPMGEYTLEKILHSWKSFTAKRINAELERDGSVWQRESYDHLIRDRADLMHHIHYVRENPSKAGLVDWAWVG